jgi:hypothetical protein
LPAESGRENNVVRGGSGTFTPPADEPALDVAAGALAGAFEVAGLEPNGLTGGVWPGGADGGIAAMTTAAGLDAWRSPKDPLSAPAPRDCSEPKFGSNRGDDRVMAGGTAGLAGSSSRFGTSEPRPLCVSASPPGNAGSNRPVLPNVDGVEDGSGDDCEKPALG